MLDTFGDMIKRLFNRKKIIPIALGILILSPSLSSAQDIIVPGTQPTIRAALKVAKAGDKVIVEKGEYFENIVISKSVVLESRAGAESTIIHAADPQKSTIKVENAKSVSIIGFTIRNSNVAGINLYKSSLCTIKDNKLLSNNRGVYLSHVTNTTIENNVMKENVEGIRLTHSHKNRLTGNSADSNKEKGFNLLNSNENVIINNTANSNYWNGITLWSSNYNVVKGNKVVKNTYAIVEGGSKDNEIVDNRTMRRLHLILPIFLVYFGIVLYLIEKKLFITYYSKKTNSY